MTAGPARTGPRVYTRLALMSARSVTNYRAAFVLSYLGTFVQVLALMAIWRVLLEGGRGLEGFTWPQMKAYLLVAFVTTSLVSLYADFGMASRIHDGLVAVDLTRPVDYQVARFAETVGRCAVEFLLAASIVVLVAVLLGDVAGPAPGAVGMFVLSLLIVVPLKFVVVYGSTLLCFWTQNYLGVLWARTALVGLFSGALVPLAFLPGWFQTVAAVLPFVGLTATPAALYLGRVTGGAAWLALAAQLGWTVALWWLARVAFRRAVRRVTVHGG